MRALYSHDYADREATLELAVPGEPVQPVVTVASYLPFGPLEEITLGNGLTETHTFDERYYPARITVAGGAPLLDWQYTVDDVGNPTAIADLLDPLQNRSYGYQDYQYYLTSGVGPWGNLSWLYDKIGNRLRETRGGVADVYSYVANAASGNTAKLAQIQLGAGGSRVYGFDAGGFQQQVTTGGDPVSFNHDAAGQLGAIERPSAGVQAAMSYDGRGFLRSANELHPGLIFGDDFETGDFACWSAVVGGAGGGSCPLAPSVEPVYSSEGVLHYQLKEGGLERYVLYFAGRPVLLVALPAEGPVEVTWLAADHLGTPILASSSAGAASWAGGFEPFGADFAGAQAAGVYLRLAGQWQSEAWVTAGIPSNLDYNVYRWHQPSVGRYDRPGPIGLNDILNLYGFAANNPVVATDPLGLLVQLYCHLVGQGGGISPHDAAGAAGFKHCFVRVRCECSPEPYDLRLEVTGRNWGTGMADIPPVPPTYGDNHGADRVAFRPGDNDSRDCAKEECIRQEYFRRREAGQPYGGYLSGPNSNTFAADLLTRCGTAQIFWPTGVPPFTPR
ncbi:MAG: RHS repeat-associated core domain-containing protein [Thermoanaerobaculia bacterium]|nr:RHS repeat-associated core domain-containing protein [Thermoanaerobaculia bacterium]